MNLIECFGPSLRDRPGEPALAFDGRQLTFGEIDRASDRVALALAALHGIEKGDRVALCLDGRPELITCYLGCLKLGAVVVPLNPSYRERELSGLLLDAEPRIILTDRERHDLLGPLLVGELASVESVVVAGGGDDADAWPPPDAGRTSSGQAEGSSDPGSIDPGRIRGDDPALMIYTSGTTGAPKGAVLTHDNLASNIAALLHCWRWTADDRLVLALPLFHLHGLGVGIHGWLATGCHMTLFARFAAERVLDAMLGSAATLFFGVPTMYERFLEAAAEGAPVPTGMRLFVSGSAPLSPETFSRFEAVFGHKILERYGMSETAMITSNLYSGPNARVQGSVGRTLPGVCLRIADERGQPVPPGTVGELQVRGPNVMRGYWRRPRATREAFTPDDWFKTGDLGHYDEAGNVVLTGRAKDLIISSGFNVYPQEVVNCLVEHASVRETAVIGVADRRRGEAVKAYVVRDDESLTSEELIAFCKQRMAGYKVPRAVEFLQALPRNAMGKLERRRLPNRDRL